MYKPYFSSSKPCWLCIERFGFVAAFSVCILEMELLDRLMSSFEIFPFLAVMHAGEQSHTQLNETTGFLEDRNGKSAV